MPAEQNLESRVYLALTPNEPTNIEVAVDIRAGSRTPPELLAVRADHLADEAERGLRLASAGEVLINTRETY